MRYLSLVYLTVAIAGFAPQASAADDRCIGVLEDEINALLSQFGSNMPADVEAEWMRLGALATEAYQDGDIARTCRTMAANRDFLAQQVKGGNVGEEEADCLTPLQDEVNALTERFGASMPAQVEEEMQRRGSEAADAAGAGDMKKACALTAKLRDYLARKVRG